MLPIDEVENRPDVISRIFWVKLEEVKKDMLRKHIFGKVVAFTYTIEFQKRGLLHAHFLNILKEKYKLLTPEAYDQFVCAELLDSKANSNLFKPVTLFIIHDTCVN